MGNESFINKINYLEALEPSIEFYSSSPYATENDG